MSHTRYLDGMCGTLPWGPLIIIRGVQNEYHPPQLTYMSSSVMFNILIMGSTPIKVKNGNQSLDQMKFIFYNLVYQLVDPTPHSGVGILISTYPTHGKCVEDNVVVKVYYCENGHLSH